MFAISVPAHALPVQTSMDATAWIVVAVVVAVVAVSFVYGLMRALRTWPPAKTEVEPTRADLPKAA